MNMKQKPQLGKGMAALLGGGPIGAPSQKILHEPGSAKVETKTIIEHQPMLVPLENIIPNRGQPRKIFKEKDLLELAESIKENGVIQPLLVAETEGGKFELIAGERRLRASKLAGLEGVPVLVKRVTKKDNMVMAIIENVQRSDLNCIEEGLAYFQLMNEFGLTQEEVAKKVGKERSTVANFLRILKLPKDVIMLLNKEQLSFGHAKVLVGLGDDESAKRFANEAATKNLSVRELEDLVKAGKKKVKAKEGKNIVAERYDQLKDRLEKKTGFHFALKSKKNGAGSITIKFSNEAEFNDVFGYLMK
ncbi:MAG: ParB/RepB/Spo0J family partition protein [Bacteriovoracaceae bacterium]|nr:ParB/RepB/Spo0J family partition protein [Bacteriovoracaceae bacterium]